MFIVSGIREGYERTGNTVDAVAYGLGPTGVVVTSAAAIMSAIFGSFRRNTIPEMKQMGFGLAVAVLLDATLIRVTLVPAFMKIPGTGTGGSHAAWTGCYPNSITDELPNAFYHVTGSSFIP